MIRINDIELLSSDEFKDRWSFITVFETRTYDNDVSFALIFKNQHIFDCSIKQYFKIKNSVIKLFDINLFGFLSIGIVTIPEVAREAFNLVKSLYAPWRVEYKMIDEALVLTEGYRYIIQRDQTWYKEILKMLKQQ